ncbi:ATP-binding cassette domain-containing protein [Azospirillum melinis]|uniref:ATP-binding cassette domain-containing protein n=1 Tax=Azospirillum melinis TaxID=328839 RepID=A0ABX2KI68_9PROT|nr:ABC transporter ATP-binding protein [Azospirillum melinis]MBP2307081.1 iron(III) transport system ATP-binding protein [Azospirillum melinis]NUB02247.1 ATP-binding cassette domain-containing protein [Azospirillum melinis]
MSGIRITNLRKSFGSYTALRGIDLQVPNGTLLALLGPSGCGKSTTLQLLAGFESPTEGEIWADDVLLSSPRGVLPPERRGISLVFQNYAVWPHKTVAENVAFGLSIRRLPKAEIAERLTRALRTVRLESLRDRYPSELSGGQQQRVALARALVVEPSILLLDEPLSNLDAHLREEMRFEIRQVHDLLGITTVYVTHDQSEALVTADRIAVMKAGAVQQFGTPEDVFERPANAFVARFIGSNNELSGTGEGEGSIRIGDRVLTAPDRSGVARGGSVSLCVRPSKVRLDDDGGLSCNSLPGTIVRSAYLGEHRDVLVDIGEGRTIRAFVPPERRYGPGAVTTVHLPIDACQILAPSA